MRYAMTAVLALVAGGAMAQDWVPGANLYGGSGLIEMPSAYSLPDAELMATVGGLRNHRRTTLTFQITPRLTGSFRYSRVGEFYGPGTKENFDRSFDLQYRLVDEGKYRPAVAIGLRDFMGTGIYSSEYIVASKQIGSRMQVTGGLGFGRLGTRGGFDNPFGIERPALDYGEGGKISFGQFFRGDAAVFGGVEYNATDRIRIKAEYSSDAYAVETSRGSFEAKSGVNFGVSWRPIDAVELAAYSLYGKEVGLSATIMMNPARSPAQGRMARTPVPMFDRDRVTAARSWAPDAAETTAYAARLAKAAEYEGLGIVGVEPKGNAVRVRVANDVFQSDAQAIGRMARILTQMTPGEVDEFQIEIVRDGIPVSQMVIPRDEMVRLEGEPGAADKLWSVSRLSDAEPDNGLMAVPETGAEFDWKIVPYYALTFFNPNKPVQVQAGPALTVDYQMTPNLFLHGEARYALLRYQHAGSTTVESSNPVRTDKKLFGRENDLQLGSLYVQHTARLAPSVYSKVSAGYLETMYGGVAAEVLWKPAGSRLGLGGEIVYARKRDYDMGFGFQDFDTVTGHLSAYYEFDNGFIGQLDVGRYLAGDTGATVSLEREFANGWRVGGYATLTDMPFDEYGEGSFDKGIRVTIPNQWLTGARTRKKMSLGLASLTRDGGARVHVPGNLYDDVRTGHLADMSEARGLLVK